MKLFTGNIQRLISKALIEFKEAYQERLKLENYVYTLVMPWSLNVNYNLETFIDI